MQCIVSSTDTFQYEFYICVYMTTSCTLYNYIYYNYYINIQ